MSHGMCGDRRPVSQLHAADDLPELMRRALRSLVRAEELAKDLDRVSTAECDALRSGFLILVRRYVVHLRDEGAAETCATNRVSEALDDSLMPCNVRHHCAVHLEAAERCVADVYSSELTSQPT
jgi:hypothetical protein